MKVEISNPTADTQFIWHHNDNLVQSSENSVINSNINSSVLSLRNIKLENSGKYNCKIVNKVGSSISNTNVRVTCKPSFVRPLENFEGFDDDKITLYCEVMGVPEPKVTWFKDDQPFKPSLGSSVSCKNGVCTLVILNALPKDSGEYKCRAQNKSGFNETKALVNIKGEELKFVLKQNILYKFNFRNTSTSKTTICKTEG